MSIESAVLVNELNDKYPRNVDLIKEGAPHLRLLKTTLRNTFPNISGAVNATHSFLNELFSRVEFLSGQVSVKTSEIINVGTPTLDTSAATRGSAKAYVDTLIANYATAVASDARYMRAGEITSSDYLTPTQLASSYVAKTNLTSGTAAPSGGVDGDVYIQYL